MFAFMLSEVQFVIKCHNMALNPNPAVFVNDSWANLKAKLFPNIFKT